MQTKHQIQEFLNLAGASPRRNLGQNFLIDLNLILFIIDSAAIRKNDVVLEVGCTTGSLTEEIAELAGKVVDCLAAYAERNPPAERQGFIGFRTYMGFVVLDGDKVVHIHNCCVL